MIIFIVKSILKITKHVLKRLQKNFEYFTSKSKAHGTFLKLAYKINISETNGPYELKFCILPIFKI